MKLEQPILFHTLEELQEAVNLNVLSESNIVPYKSGRLALPALFLNVFEGIIGHQNGLVLLNQNNEYLSILRESIDWKDAREQYKPKEWYELNSSIGKPVWVRDTYDEKWKLGIFRGYHKGSKYSYKCGITYRYAKPVTTEDLIKDKQ